MFVSMLGPMSVRVTDEETVIAAAKQRVVLAALLVRANQAVSFDELASAVWDCAPPASSRATLRNYVKSLRQALGPASCQLVTRDPGYLIRIGPDELDVLRFRSLCEQGGAAVRQQDWQRAAALLAEALELWRGNPLADVPSERLRMEVLPGLERLRWQATEWRADADLNLGRHADLVLELQCLVAEQPLRERFHAQLMLALYRSGRVAEALAAYEQARLTLADQLGADPGPELRRLHEFVLRSDARLAAPSAPGTSSAAAGMSSLLEVPSAPAVLSTPAVPSAAGMSSAPAVPSGPAAPSVSAGQPARYLAGDVPRQLPCPPRYFAGRARELVALRRLAEPAPAVTPVIAIVGTAGVGKTALALRFAHEQAARFPDGQLYVNLRGFDPSGSPVTPAEAIRGFLAALGADPRRVPADVAAQAGLYRSMIAGRQLLIVLDNAHDAGQVRPLLPGSGGCLVVVTSRSRLTGLVAADGAHPLSLDLLAYEEARELLSQRLGVRRLAAGADRIITLCARLPLALGIAAAHAATRPELPLADLAAELHDARRRLDGLDTGDAESSVRAVFSWSYESVSGRARRLFRLLAVHPGPDISAAAAASLAALPVAQASRALNELAGAHLIAEQVSGRFSFHDLLRAYAGDQGAVNDGQGEQRAAIRRELDHYLHTAHAADRQLIPARDPIILDEPVPGVCPESVSDSGAALAWFRAEHQVLIAMVGQASEHGFARHAWQVAWTLVTYLERQGCWAEWAAAQRAALDAARQIGDVLGQAHAHRQLARFHISVGAPAGAGEHLGHAIQAFHQVGDRVAEARARLDVARMLEGQGSYREAIEHALRALDLFRVVGHRTGQARALNGIGWCHAHLGEYAQTLEFCRQALDLHRELGSLDGEPGTLDSLGYAHLHLGHHAEAIDCYRRALRLYQAEEDRYGEAACLGDLGDAYADVGDRFLARRSWRQALAIMDDLGHPDAGGIRIKLASHPAPGRLVSSALEA
jgi:DNA-binding SARP family transcriptional activator